MSKHSWTLFISIALIVVALLVVPIRRGAQICTGSDTRAHQAYEIGLPFSYYTPSQEIKDSCFESLCIASVSDTSTGSCGVSVPSKFESASLWFDLLVSGSILLAAFYLLGIKKVVV